ncbi:hypothetical protein B0J11DRAFT_549789 [Dendryphion nanum]|uniref:Uncharacterized protein n=1 Tax=Dendryphion nanum TaxID=256645 RepID=A0A9P9DXF9_9PLEO|nr:hypothetical protein B0J11DRAFT_549789 [Dendryphion nanum]
MHHPPQPHYSFTIPSVHDDTTLECRIYHPEVLSRPRSHESNSDVFPTWGKKGIVMAHPYAPMGVPTTIVLMGYVVGTFNFRGAHASKGRTSWSGKPEVDDYISFAAFFIHYLSFIHPFPSSSANFTPEQSPVSPRLSKRNELCGTQDRASSIVVLGGYSYGSLILRNLPPVPSILQPFCAPLNGSSASEILLRAHKLSDQSNLEWINQARDNERQKRRGHDNKLSVTMGGEETSPDVRRSSREIRRSIDGRRSLDLGDRLRSLSHRRRKDSAGPKTPPEGTARPIITVPEIRYFLVSPLTAPISTLAAPGLAPKFWSKDKSHSEIFGRHNSLAVFGDHDIFSAVKKVKQWAEKLESEPGSKFSHVEIAGAGHFWVEEGVEMQLRTTMREWGG